MNDTLGSLQRLCHGEIVENICFSYDNTFGELNIVLSDHRYDPDARLVQPVNQCAA